MRIENLTRILRKFITYLLLFIYSIGIINFVFLRYNTQRNNPEAPLLEIIVLGFLCIFSFGFLMNSIKKNNIGIYGYIVTNIITVIIAQALNYLSLRSYSVIGLIGGLVLLLLIRSNRVLYNK